MSGLICDLLRESRRLLSIAEDWRFGGRVPSLQFGRLRKIVDEIDLQPEESLAMWDEGEPVVEISVTASGVSHNIVSTKRISS